MHLRDYLASKPRGTATLIARDSGVPLATISNIARDRHWPRRDAWQRIVAATDGQVTPNDHLNTGRTGA